MESFVQKKNIAHTTSSAYSHCMNSWIERYFRSLRAMRKATLLTSNCPKNMWSAIDKRCAFIRNCLGYPHLDPITEKCPIFMLEQKMPSLKYLLEFWAPVYPITDAYVRKQDFSNKTKMYRYLYMEEFQIGNRIYDESNNSTLVRGPLIHHNVFDPIKRHLSPHGHIYNI